MYEIIEDYKEAKTDKEKREIFNLFCSSIWNSNNKRRIYNKTINFKVRKDLLNTELGKVFDSWSNVDYKYYKSMTKETDWISIIRQKINNLYTRYFDKEVILKKEYMDLIKTPKKLYYEWIAGTEMKADAVTQIIDEAIIKSMKIKDKFQKEKMDLPWNDYKKLIEEILNKCFINCKLIEDYEDKKSINRLDYLTEDHFYVGYFCRYLENEIKQYEKKYYGVRQHQKYKRCKTCGSLIEKDAKNRQYCHKCAKKKRAEINRNYYIKTVLKCR